MANIAKTDPKGPVNANIRLSRNSPTGYKTWHNGFCWHSQSSKKSKRMKEIKMTLDEIRTKYLGDKSLLELSRSNDPKDKQKFKKYSNEQSSKTAINRISGKNFQGSVKKKMLNFMQKEAKGALDQLNAVKTRANVDIKAYEKNPAIVKAADEAIRSCKTLISLIEQNQKASV